MAKAYSADIRMRVIARVEGGSSRREAAEQLDISPSAAVKWVKYFHETGSCAAKPRGGSTSPLEVHAPWLLTLIEARLIGHWCLLMFYTGGMMYRLVLASC